MKKRKLLCCILIILAFIILCSMLVNEQLNKNVRCVEYSYAFKELPKEFDGYKILLISDLHNAPFSENIIKHIQEQNPDVIVFTGDMVQLPDYNLDETLKIADYARGKIPMYAVSGNHETQNKEYDHIMGELWDNGIIHLEHDSIELEKNGQTILLVGIRDPQDDYVNKYHGESIVGKIQKELNKNDEEFSVLLSHRANIFPMIKNSGVDLILSGHLHGGVVRLPFVGGIKGDGYLPKYDYGIYNEDGCVMIVSGGCDKNPEKKRVFNPPEVVLITLKAQ